MKKLSLCNNCLKFPLCDECKAQKNYHTDECQLLRSWKFTNNHYSKHLFRALTVIRGLLLEEDDKVLMNMMACHQHATVQNIEVEKILNEFEDLKAESDIVIELKKISSILNTNAFELSILSSNDSILSLRVSFYLKMYLPILSLFLNPHKIQLILTFFFLITNRVFFP